MDYICYFKNAATRWRESFLAEASGTGRELSRAVLFDEDELWNECADLWLQGRGFRDAVHERLEGWFERHPGILELIDKRIKSAWEAAVIRPLRELSDPAPASA